jgi:hypothetical protein
MFLSLLSSLSSHRRLAIGGAAAAVALGVGGTALAVHATSPDATTSTTQPSPPAAVTTPAPASHKHAVARHTAVVRFVSATATSLTVADASGAQTTYAVTPKTRVTGSGGATEGLSSVGVGELVVVVSPAGTHGGKSKLGAQPSPASTPVPAPIRPAAALQVEDTGFAAR